MGLPEPEIVVRQKVVAVVGGVATVETSAEQGGKQIVRNAEAQITSG